MLVLYVCMSAGKVKCLFFFCFFPNNTGCLFWLVPPLKLLSVEDGKIPTKKVKVFLSNSKMWNFSILLNWSHPTGGGTSKKRHLVYLYYHHPSLLITLGINAENMIPRNRIGLNPSFSEWGQTRFPWRGTTPWCTTCFKKE